MSGATGGKFYQLPPEKENTVFVWPYLLALLIETGMGPMVL